MKRRSGLARYEDVESSYLEKRRLRPSANWLLLWALGVGAVISGDFFGWNFGLAGGFWGLLIATGLMALMYWLMVFSIAELSAALPHAGGFYSFVRNALGPTAGFVCGVTDTIEYVVTPAVIVVAIGSYSAELVANLGGGTLEELTPWNWLWWSGAYGLFVWINIRGVELTLRVGLVITLLALLILVAFYTAVLLSGSFEVSRLFNIPAEPGEASWLPRGVGGIFAALPYAMWFYLAIEQLPLAAEESHDVVRDMPRALVAGFLTLLALSLLTLVLNTGVGGGAAELRTSTAPLVDGFRSVLGDRGAWLLPILTLVALTGLISSFHAIVYAYGRVLFALSRAGYFPRWMSITGKRQTPWVALVLGALVGLGCALLQAGREESQVGKALISMAVFGAVLSYALVMLSFIWLRITRPELERPYRSPLGIPGAALGGLLALVALAATFADPDLRPGVYGVAAFLVVTLPYYFFYSRYRLVAQAPEEAAALGSAADED